MSSDEKALKPSERIAEIYRTRKDMTPAQSIIQYLDEQAELLDTHTENETKAHKQNTCTCPCHNKHDTHYPL